MTDQPEFSRPIAVQQLGASDTRMEIEADVKERAALARRFDLVALEGLRAELRLRRIGGSRLIRLRGRLTADVVQSCVVSLQDVRAHVEETFEMVFGPPEDIEPDAVDIMVSIDEADPPEPIHNGIIDTGEAVAEHLALALDPFPRAPGAQFEDSSSDGGGTEESQPQAFSALESLKKKLG